MTPAEVAAIRKAWAGTTQGTWQKDRNWHISLVGIDWDSYSPRDKVICQVNGPSYHAARDEDFIIAAHNTFVPALCDVLEAAWGELALCRAESTDVLVNQALEAADLSARRMPAGILATEVRRLQVQVATLEARLEEVRQESLDRDLCE